MHIISNKKYKLQIETISRMINSMTTQKRKIADLERENKFLFSKYDEVVKNKFLLCKLDGDALHIFKKNFVNLQESESIFLGLTKKDLNSIKKFKRSKK